ncbi:uncharacterized protein Dvar_09940 [Desulfosarcina variabilis str. Montpellier]|uniref:hypothetical protein n=1 Tax=Desulfosarcina variabilis TaxID=2300 RepID=UPI003AFB14BA
MNPTLSKRIAALLVGMVMVLSGGTAQAEKPIVIGCPLPTAFLYGWDAERGATLAIEEINAQGGGGCGWQETPFQDRSHRYAGSGAGCAGQRGLAGRLKTDPGQEC